MNTTAAAAINADYIAGAVQEAVRLARTSSPPGPQPPVRPFAKPNYRDGERKCGGCMGSYSGLCVVTRRQFALLACCSLLMSVRMSTYRLLLAQILSCCGIVQTSTNRVLVLNLFVVLL